MIHELFLLKRQKCIVYCGKLFYCYSFFWSTAGHRKSRKTRKENEETLASAEVSAALSAVIGKAGQAARLAKVPKSFGHELSAVARVVTNEIKKNPYFLPFDVYAAPTLQVLMLALQARQHTGKGRRLITAMRALSNFEKRCKVSLEVMRNAASHECLYRGT